MENEKELEDILHKMYLEEEASLKSVVRSYPKWGEDDDVIESYWDKLNVEYSPFKKGVTINNVIFRIRQLLNK